jgi:hypothetical protein
MANYYFLPVGHVISARFGYVSQSWYGTTNKVLANCYQ